eukprot:CAMPEP_0202966522 /NCGR_PEP_ID=MMETSP1396-20130829/10971_1 /ASSEMBLY_ACC=CAM_ASM_000872 /TAXON_ID= /ORGANISM="Pseudokeronopsis sp., Strain Brazil" /LENGTH=63 /DNA_ID=CAMNT_0049690483 /DNA_START=75 /DNA_END=266 /DNA_ORIENTATION=+
MELMQRSILEEEEGKEQDRVESKLNNWMEKAREEGRKEEKAVSKLSHYERELGLTPVDQDALP